jgi:hypothetical protein
MVGGRNSTDGDPGKEEAALLHWLAKETDSLVKRGEESRGHMGQPNTKSIMLSHCPFMECGPSWLEGYIMVSKNLKTEGAVWTTKYESDVEEPKLFEFPDVKN